MKTIKGPAIFLAQFAGDAAPFNSLDAICGWAASLGYQGVQIPSWDGRLFDLEKAAGSKDYCDVVKGTVESHGLTITELSTHLQGQLVAVHPAYDEGFDAFAPAAGPRQSQGAPGMGGAADAVGRQGLAPSRPRCPCHLLRRSGLSLPLSLAAPAEGPDRYRVHRAGQALAADPGRFRRGGCRRLLRDPSRRGPARRRRRSSASWARSTTIRAAASTTTRRTSCCRRWTTCSSSISTTSGSRPSTSRTPSSTRPAGRASIGGFEDWVEPGRPLPLAGRRRGRFLQHLQQAQRLRLRLVGGARVGMLPQERRGRRARGGRVHRRAHHQGDREGVRRLRRRQRRRGRQPAGARPRPVTGDAASGWAWSAVDRVP